jgi:hypothetical protein
MATVLQAAPALGIVATCAAFNIARATYYRHVAPMFGPKLKRPSPPRRLPDEERKAVLSVLHEPRFVDLAPAEVFATLLEAGTYLCSLRTMHCSSTCCSTTSSTGPCDDAVAFKCSGESRRTEETWPLRIPHVRQGHAPLLNSS